MVSISINKNKKGLSDINIFIFIIKSSCIKENDVVSKIATLGEIWRGAAVVGTLKGWLVEAE